MVVKIRNKEIDLKFSFNSFKYMQDFDVNTIAEIESKPFKLIPLVEMLMMGAVNNHPKVRISLEDVQAYIEEYSAENSLADLLTELMGLLEESNFFKNLQKK